MKTPTHRNVEPMRRAFQSDFDAGKPAADRNRLGQFATPNSLAIEIARYVDTLLDGRSDLRFADPSIGTGSFFSAALEVFGRERIGHAIGIELDVKLTDAARSLWSEFGLEVIRDDFTQFVVKSSLPPPNLVLANPPYVRHHHLEGDEKRRLQALTRECTGIEVSGLAGLYVHFLLLATAWMAEGGLSAWLIPSEFMDVNYGRALRQFLTNRVTLLRIHRFDPDDVQFEDALVSSAVVVFRKAMPSAGHSADFSYGGTLATPRHRDEIPLEQLGMSRKWSMYPKHDGNDRRKGQDGGPVLADFFHVCRGIATGDNKFFVLPRREAESRGFPAEALKPILPSPRHLKATVIDPDDEGYPAIEPQLCVIDSDLPERVLRVRHPALWDYLQTAEPLGVRGGYIVGKRNPWYKQERRAPAPFLCTYMGRGANEKSPFRFIYNRSDAIGTNLYLLLYPRLGLAEMLSEHPERGEAVYELLNGVGADELRGEGRVYGGGLNKIEPRELGRVSAAAFVERWPELTRTTCQSASAGLFD